MALLDFPQDSLSAVFTALLADGDKRSWCSLSAACKATFRVAKLGAEQASRRAAEQLRREVEVSRLPAALCFPNNFRMCKTRCDHCVALLKMSGETITPGNIRALPGWHAPSHEIENRRHQLERHLGTQPVDGGNAKKTSLPSKFTTIAQLRAAASASGDDAPIAKALLAAIGDFCTHPSAGGVKQVAARVEDAHSLLVACRAKHPTDDLTPACEVIERMLRDASSERWAWCTLVPAEDYARPLVLRISICKHAEAEQLCFCGTDRHLHSNALSFEGKWVYCGECKRCCHAECTGLDGDGDAAAAKYVCPMCYGTESLDSKNLSAPARAVPVVARVASLRREAAEHAEAKRHALRRAKEAELCQEAADADKPLIWAQARRRLRELSDLLFAKAPALKALVDAGILRPLQSQLFALFYLHVHDGRTPRRSLPTWHRTVALDKSPSAVASSIFGRELHEKIVRFVRTAWGARVHRALEQAWEEEMLADTRPQRLLAFLLDASRTPTPPGAVDLLASVTLRLLQPVVEHAVAEHEKREREAQEKAHAEAAARLREELQQAEQRRREEVERQEAERRASQERRDREERERLQQQHAAEAERARRKRRKLGSDALDAIWA